MSANRFGRLLEPKYIGKVKIRNSIIKTGAGTSFIEKDGQVGDRIVGFYERLAEGGVGLVTVESTGVDYPTGIHHPSVQLHLENDNYIPGYRRLTESVHKHNCPVFLQLFHSGPWHPSSWSGIQAISASALSKSELPNPQLDEPREVTRQEIGGLVKKFADAAVRAQKAGFDGVEVNASSTHLINSFISPGWNKRQDEYGPQTLENRSRFLVEIIREIKSRLGSDFPVSVLLTGAEYGISQGMEIGDACGIAKIIAAAGVDAVQVRGYGYGKYNFIHPGPEQLMYPEPIDPMPAELDWSKKGAGAFVPLSEAFKKVVSIPVIAVGRIDPELGESILKQGKADIIAMNRRLLADPELPLKIASGRREEVAPCTACLYCWSRRRQNKTIKCRINSRLGRERELVISPVQKAKNVLVVGSGPSGMEAARVAAMKGHKVTIIEKEKRVGGLLPLAAMVKGCRIEDVPSIVSYFQRQLSKLGVRIEMGKEADRHSILKYNPEVVIIATGGIPSVPDIPGIQNKKVLLVAGLHKKLKFFLKIFNAAQLNMLSGIWMPVGKNVIIIGSGVQACELAEFLVKRGRNITVVDMEKLPGANIVPEETRESLINWLKNKGTLFYMGAVVEEIISDGIRIKTEQGEIRVIKADSIIPALPLNPDPAIFESFSSTIKELYCIGDCREPGLIADAVSSGADIGYKL